jgi:pimeloyl-ACP methyl ester carboxylesterase
MSAPFGGLPTRWPPTGGNCDASPKIAIILPGVAYAPNMALLDLCRQALVPRGWAVQQVWWEAPRLEDVDEMIDWVDGEAEAAVAAEADADRLLLVGKSLGSLGCLAAARHGLPAIWLTPLLDLPRAVHALRHRTAPNLLVGGTADSSWTASSISGLGDEVLEIPDATHFLDLPGDVVGSAQIQVEVARAVTSFLNQFGVGSDL